MIEKKIMEMTNKYISKLKKELVLENNEIELMEIFNKLLGR
jgi:hypothetical protein